MIQALTALKEKLAAAWKLAAAENALEGIRLNLFGGSMREIQRYLKNINK